MQDAPKRVMLAALVALLTLGFAGSARAELRTETEITYTADVDQGRLHLEGRLVLTNLTEDVREGDTVTRFFYDEIQLTVPETMQNLQASSSGEVLSHRITSGVETDGQLYSTAVISLGRQLHFRETMEIALEFEIPGDPPRSQTTFRINPAYINFAVVAWGDPGLVTVNVVTPSSFDLELTGSDWDETRTEGSNTIHTYTAIEDLADFLIHVTGYNDSLLVARSVTVEDIELVVRAWPDDDEWSAGVSTAVASGLPTLMELIGLPWRLQEPLPLKESAEVSLAGYGGWYLLEESVIELSEWADPHTVLHELSHVWFNQDLFLGRWINEGLAEVYSVQATVDASLSEPGDLRVDQGPIDVPGVGPLNDWRFPGEIGQVDPDEIRAKEEYGYTASQWVIQEISDAIGFEAMAEVLAAADADLIAYRGAPPPERVDPGDDWRRLLDLAEELGGAKVTRDLFTRYVTDEDLTERYETRTLYDELVAAGDGWLPPLYVREPMAAWAFDAAAARITEADTILEDRLEVESNLTTLGVNLPGTLEDAYESATATLDEVGLLADQMVVATEGLVDARSNLRAERSLLMDIGLLGTDVDAEFAEALEELENEHYETAVSEARHIIELLAEAEQAGQLRLGLAAGGLVVIVGATVLIVLRRRRATRTPR